MCGIAGVARLDGVLAPGDAEAVRRMRDAQGHRGPDGSGLHLAGRAVLGHRRLAIIDLSAAAAQPMTNEDGTIWLTYNGEIYNHVELRDELVGLGHRFRSRADSEVLLHGYEAWGIPGLLERLEGMFGFALYDAPRERLVLARDRLGIKPLYYAVAGEGTSVAFASEVRALVRSGLVGRDPDPDALLGFLALGAVPAPRTVLRHARCLRPGHYLLAERGGVTERRYWELPGPVPAPVDDDPVRDLGARLSRVVARHLVSDVPLGLFLSGGVDSAALAALARRSVPGGLHTLTVTFAEPELDEAPVARRVAAAFGTEHHEVPVTAADFLQELPVFFEAMDQPTHDGVNTYFVARAARKAGLTVVLSGVGGDEVFWGYPQQQRLRRGPLAWLPALPPVVRTLAAAGAEAAGTLAGREQWRRLGYVRRSAAPERLYLALRGFFAPAQIARLLDVDRTELDRRIPGLLVEEGTARAAAWTDRLAGAFDRHQFARYLHDQLLRDTDVFAMAHSIEVRVPYLDHAVVERVAAVPIPDRLERGLNKPLLCRAVADPLVLELGRRRKRGFTLPMARWMHAHAGPLEEIALAADTLARGPVRALWRQFRAGRLHWSRAWALTVLGARGWAR
jgi:asparagine synthase (glutamine-hydrolysing)